LLLTTGLSTSVRLGLVVFKLLLMIGFGFALLLGPMVLSIVLIISLSSLVSGIGNSSTSVAASSCFTSS